MLDILINHFSAILHGIILTLTLLFSSLFIGFFFSLLFSAIKFYKINILTQIIDGFVFFIRGTPFLVQLFLIYYGPFQFHWLSHSWFATPFKSATFCALLALTFNTTAYTTNLFYTALQNLPKLELLAGKSLGLTPLQIYFTVLLPRFLMRIFPIYKNEVIMPLKCTALVSTITVLDVMGVIQQIMTETYQTIPCLLLAGAIYLILTIGLNAMLTLLSKKYMY